ncbi:MAG: hypothetical protein PF482_18330 [Desulfobacteraceae bacterium]|nr:hypothetical protein [Desulfobacteraceae bacterium]
MMIRTLASLRLTFISLTLLLTLMGVGIFLTLFPEYKNAVKAMNQTIIYQWFTTSWRVKPVLTAWFLMVCLSGALLFINTVFCSMTTQLSAALKIAKLRQWSFFIIHFMFLMVLTCHGITLISGHKQDNIRLFPGETHVFGDNYRIDILDVKFSDNPEFLTMDKKKQRQMMTRKNFHRKQNFAEISLFRDNRQLDLQKVFFLNPMKYNFLRITVTEFISKEINGRKTTGVNLVITRGFFTGFFFTVYALMIISMACFIAITWKPGTQDTHNDTPTIHSTIIKRN